VERLPTAAAPLLAAAVLASPSNPSDRDFLGSGLGMRSALSTPTGVLAAVDAGPAGTAAALDADGDASGCAGADDRTRPADAADAGCVPPSSTAAAARLTAAGGVTASAAGATAGAAPRRAAAAEEAATLAAGVPRPGSTVARPGGVTPAGVDMRRAGIDMRGACAAAGLCAKPAGACSDSLRGSSAPGAAGGRGRPGERKDRLRASGDGSGDCAGEPGTRTDNVCGSGDPGAALCSGERGAVRLQDVRTTPSSPPPKLPLVVESLPTPTCHGGSAESPPVERSCCRSPRQRRSQRSTWSTSHLKRHCGARRAAAR
jgi:hypothetical protein